MLRHRPGRLSVIRARYRTDADRRAERGWACVPFGRDHPTYVAQVAERAAALPATGFDRIVAPVGSGLTLAAILTGLATADRDVPVVGVRVGGDPTATGPAGPGSRPGSASGSSTSETRRHGPLF
ncbi:MULTISPECIES: pyridoxal-phosphate dependent enzyme [unclassified Streptomyces]|uniref:pyridoxal-phosphate dependent enzyme n=1 Tax=unclassified Streptomyces TaxID=2593676 RepID=UPI000699D7A0|nr:pyridoxal-phosphate dependent enzyme [Streptomyces sp. CNQ-509]